MLVFALVIAVIWGYRNWSYKNSTYFKVTRNTFLSTLLDKGMQKYIPEYEKLMGKKLDSQVVRIIERLDECGKQFEGRNRDDAVHNRPAASGDVFRPWENKVFGDDPEMSEIMSLMQRCYLDGYQKGGAV